MNYNVYDLWLKEKPGFTHGYIAEVKIANAMPGNARLIHANALKPDGSTSVDVCYHDHAVYFGQAIVDVYYYGHAVCFGNIVLPVFQSFLGAWTWALKEANKEAVRRGLRPLRMHELAGGKIATRAPIRAEPRPFGGTTGCFYNFYHNVLARD